MLVLQKLVLFQNRKTIKNRKCLQCTLKADFKKVDGILCQIQLCLLEPHRTPQRQVCVGHAVNEEVVKEMSRRRKADVPVEELEKPELHFQEFLCSESSLRSVELV